MKTNYDFSNAKKNPYKNDLKKGYSVTVHYRPEIEDKDEPQPENQERAASPKEQKTG